MADPMASDAAALAAIEAMRTTDAAARSAGIALASVADGRAVVTMIVTAQMLNGPGTCHGGYLFLLADVAFSYACNTGGHLTVAASADITYVVPAYEGDELTATAQRRLHFGRDGRDGFYDVTVTRGPDVVAVFTGRSRQIEPKSG